MREIRCADCKYNVEIPQNLNRNALMNGCGAGEYRETVVLIPSQLWCCPYYEEAIVLPYQHFQLF